MFNPLDFPLIDEIAAGSLAEDVGRGDVTSRAVVKSGQVARGNFMAKQELVLAGLEVSDAVFMHLDPHLQIESTAGDGEVVQEGKV
ncbi:MAG TPA: nicotinate-nucleotide diphosphorylase (carboxylating), partial [Blastocatellia bacterium]|nr:nicotinate-nucleotide diphosphorylase (carboxylating) [Blastocatellia bacterium]